MSCFSSAKISKWKFILFIGVVATMLQGCTLFLSGGVSMGTQAALDRRTIGTQTDDKMITVKGELLASDLVEDRGHVNVTCFNYKILLTGEVASEDLKDALGNQIAEIEGVTSVVNQLTVGESSSFTERTQDTWITSKVSASFMESPDLFAHSLKTVTERSVVYLMGRVTEREGNSAAERASKVSGVTRVVKVFDYLTEEELQALSWNANSSTETSSSTETPASTSTETVSE